MKSIVLAVLVATLAGCAVVPLVPLGPPVYIGIHGGGGYGYGGGHGGGRGGWR